MVQKQTAAPRRGSTRQTSTRHVAGKAAAQKVHQAEHMSLNLPIIGPVDLPPPEHLMYYGGIGLLAGLEIIEWPIALLVAAGHALSQQQHSRAIEELGEGLEEGS